MIAAIIGWIWLIGWIVCFCLWTKEFRKKFEFFSAVASAALVSAVWPIILFDYLTDPSK